MTQELDEEMEDMPNIWQNHEQRITALEVSQTTMKQEFKDVKDAINKGNEEQSQKLDTIHERLFEEFFHKKRTDQKERWKFLGSFLGYLLGGGSVLYLVVEKLF